jgi:S-adenosyl-L-methionine hydrolase (adenosine-forming)
VSVVCLLSDFGVKDHYVGVMKACVLRQCPRAQLVDLTHQVIPQSVSEGSYYLQQSVTHFPDGSIFLCVVDPGVGSARKAVAVQAGPYSFVAPDNGLIADIVEELGGMSMGVELAVPPDASNTFHGRDVFAPAAGRLAAGVKLSELGTPLSKLISLSGSTKVFSGNRLEITVLTIDHFGNVIFDFPKRYGWEALVPGNTFRMKERDVMFAATYGRVLLGESLLLWNSSSYLELAVRNGSAAREWGLKVGQRVVLLAEA